MGNVFRNDATSTIKGFIYQFYQVIDYCYELQNGQSIYIEKFGDITRTANEQIEVKNYSDDLTDVHDNFWNTIENWMIPEFDPNKFKQLILLTTQKIGKNCKFINWNNIKPEEKRGILDNILVEYEKRENRNKEKCEKIKVLLNNVNKEKLRKILERFVIFSEQPDLQNIHNVIKEKHLKDIPEPNQDTYLYELIGFILNPAFVSNNVGWEIKYKDFVSNCTKLTEIYCSKTRIFPKITKPTDTEIRKVKNAIFVKKIDDIHYGMDVKNDAIIDYLKTVTVINQDFNNYSISKDRINSYEDEIISKYKILRRSYKNDLANDSEIIKKSKKFYDEVQNSSVQPFLNYNDTPISFRNGMYQIMADEDNDNIKWLLEKDDE